MKAQGLPITTVILAALGLVVLVVLFAITTGRLGIFSKAIQTCQAGHCISPQDCEIAGGFSLPGNWLKKENNLPCGFVPEGRTGPPLNEVCCSAKPQIR